MSVIENKTENPAPIYSLIYAERQSNGDALITLNGPTLHGDRYNAEVTVYQYVKARIPDVCHEEFVDWAEDQLPNLKLIADDEPSRDQVADALSNVSGMQVTKVNDWYFDYMSDECNEAFYQINEHSLPA